MSAGLAAAVAGSLGWLLAPAIIYSLSRHPRGWKALSDRFPRRGDAPPPAVPLGSCTFAGWLGYNGGVGVAVDERGLHVSGLPVLLSWCHPPIFIPWAEIVEARRRPRFLLTTDYVLTLRSASEFEFALRGRTFERVRPAFARAGVRIVE